MKESNVSDDTDRCLLVTNSHEMFSKSEVSTYTQTEVDAMREDENAQSLCSLFDKYAAACEEKVFVNGNIYLCHGCKTPQEDCSQMPQVLSHN